jgi:hypothetical protein
MRCGWVADFVSGCSNLPAGRLGRKARKCVSGAGEIFLNFLLADSGFGRSNGLFFEKDERCSSVIAVKRQGTR